MEPPPFPMPQMSPMNWLFLFSFFSIAFILTMAKLSLMDE